MYKVIVLHKRRYTCRISHWSLLPQVPSQVIEYPAIVVYQHINTSSGSQYRDVLTISTNGQTAFNLQNISAIPHLSQLSFNGVLQVMGVDYIINSSVLTWTSSIPVSTSDSLIIFYS